MTKLFMDRGMKLLTGPLSLRPELSLLACSPDEVQEAPAVPTSNALARASVRRSWVVAEDSADDAGKVASAIRLHATEVSFPLLLPSKPFYLVVDALRKVTVIKSEL